MMIRIGSFLEAKSIRVQRGVQTPKRNTAARRFFWVFIFFQVLACDCGVAWCSVTNQEHSLFHAVVRLCHRIAGTVCRSVANH